MSPRTVEGRFVHKAKKKREILVLVKKDRERGALLLRLEIKRESGSYEGSMGHREERSLALIAEKKKSTGKISTGNLSRPPSRREGSCTAKSSR